MHYIEFFLQMDASSSGQRKLVEVFIDTDSESESHTSSEIGVASDCASTEETLTAEEVGVVGEEGVADDGESMYMCMQLPVHDCASCRCPVP